MKIVHSVVISLLALMMSNGGLGQKKESNQQASEKILERLLCGEVRRCRGSVVMEALMDDKDASWVVSDALTFAELPGGYAALPNYSDKFDYKFRPVSLKLEDILNSIVIAEPRYKWNVSNGVINVMPVEEYPLLNLRISEFRMEDATVNEMIDALSQHPEFKQGLAALKLEETHPPSLEDAHPPNDNGFAFSGAVGKPVKSKKRFSVALKFATVRQILNEIVRQDDCAIWSYEEWAAPKYELPNHSRQYKLGLLFQCP